MRRTYRKKSNLINKTGYTPGYSTEHNPVNYIPSEHITMANTPYPLQATPLNENGEPIGDSLVMRPGGEYRFPGASYVEETPVFKDGGKNDWISAKISLLVKEGYPQKQAVAIAYSMYDNIHSDGGEQLPMYQFGNTFPGSNFKKPKFSADPNIASPEQFSEDMNKITEVNPGKYGLGKDPNAPSLLSTDSLTAGEDFKKRTDEIGKAAGLPQQDFSKNIFGDTGASSTEDPNKVKDLDIKGGQPFQFFNPYSGFDIPTAASTLGSSIENGDTLGTIGSGLKLATGLARNVFGGMGQARRNNYLQKQYYEKQREGMTGSGREEMLRFGGYYQDGGEEPSDVQEQVVQALQQGMSPEDVLQQLVQMGMPEDQATSLIQSIMQQMQPSTPQLKRGGMMYYQDGGDEDDEEYDDLINKYPNQNSEMEDEEEEEPGEQEETNEVEKEEPKYDKNSARDTWVAKTGLPWSEAKRLGYTNGSAKDNIKLLSELNDPRFNKKYLRSKPFTQTVTKTTPKTQVAANAAPKAGASRFMFTSDKAYQDYLKANKLEAPKQNSNMLIPMAPINFSPSNNYPMFRQAYQDGGEQQIAQQVAQAIQQGMQPQEAMAMLVKSGMTQDQAVELVQAIIAQIQQQGHNPKEEAAEGGNQVPQEEVMEQGTPQLRKGGAMCYQDGGDAQGMQPQAGDEEIQAIMQQVMQMLQQGAQPEQILQMLVESGIPEDQATQLVQMVIQQMQQQGHNPEEESAEGASSNPQEEAMEQGTPQMRTGGKYMRTLIGKTIKSYKYNPKTDSYTVSYE